MDDKLALVAAEACKNPGVAEMLGQILTGPNDRAYVVCTFMECKLNIKGHCNIYTVQDVPAMKTGVPCDRYETKI